MNKQFIEEVLQARRSQAEAEEAEKKAGLQIEADRIIEEIKSGLGEFWPIVEASGAKPTAYIENGKVSKIEYKLPVIDELELAPIRIEWGKGYRSGLNLFVRGNSEKDLAAALEAAREYYPEYKERERLEYIADLEKKLHYYHGVKEEAEALQIYDRLCEEAPERQAQWDDLIQRWKQYRIDQAERIIQEAEEKAEREAQEKARAELMAQYTEELVGWLRQYEEISGANQAEATAIQEAADLIDKYRAYKLTYAIVARDEEEGMQFETRSVWTRQEEPNGQGYWMVKGNAFKPFYIVSIEGFDFNPSSGPISKNIR